LFFFFFSSRRRHTRSKRDWSSDVCSSDLSTDELVIIESYFHQNASVSKISEQIGRARQTVHNVVTFLKDGHTALDFYKRYKANKQRCGRKQTELSNDQRAYVAE